MHCATLYSGVTNHSAVFGHMSTENTVDIKKYCFKMFCKFLCFCDRFTDT